MRLVFILATLNMAHEKGAGRGQSNRGISTYIAREWIKALCFISLHGVQRIRERYEPHFEARVVFEDAVVS